MDTRTFPRYRISALVSVYNSATLIRGCLEDLAAQTLYLRNELEIIVVDSASSEGEWPIVEEFARTHPHIRAIRTRERESLYQAWNRAIEESRGDYLTNANSDDRHRPDALERMTAELDNHQDVALVYGDCHLAFLPNETWDKNDHSRTFRYPEFFPPAALLHYQFGPQPMWRKSAHQSVGLFDPSFGAAGDWDFNIRLALKLKARHIPEPLGLYLERPDAITFKDDTMARENQRIIQNYGTPETVVALYRQAGAPASDDEARARILVDMGNRALDYYPPWKEGKAERNIRIAQTCFRAAARLAPKWNAPIAGLAVCLALDGRLGEAIKLLNSSPNISDPTIAGNTHAIAEAMRTGRMNGGLRLVPSGLSFPTQKELALPDKADETPRVMDSHNRRNDAVRNESDRLRIAFFLSTGIINPEGANGGMETAVLQTASALARRGHRVAVVAQLGNGAEVNHQESIVESQLILLLLGDWEGGRFPEWQNEIDVLAFTSGPDRQPYARVPERVGKIALFHHQELKFLTGCDPRHLLNNVADSVICVSGAVRDNLISGGGVPDKILAVPNGIDLDVFAPQPVPRQPRRIMFVGALVRDKNPDLAIQAFLLLSPRFPEAELHLLGSAALWGAPEFLDRKAIQSINPKVFFHGVVSPKELAAEYCRSEIVVIPSRYESFSLVSLEAQACGCVPLAANIGGLPETMISGETGFLYSPNDLPTLGLALYDLLAQRNKVQQASAHAIDFVHTNFSWDKTARRYEEIFRRAAARGINAERSERVDYGGRAISIPAAVD